MVLKRTNDIFGYLFFIVGIAKLLLLIVSVIQLLSGKIDVYNGGNIYLLKLELFSRILGLVELLLFLSSIIMLIINKIKESDASKGYLYGLAAFLLEIIMPKFLMIFMLIPQCGLFIKAGSIITNRKIGKFENINETKKYIKNTEWFYGDDDSNK